MSSLHIARKSSETGARTGLLTLAHATVPTPVFMPVGTRGTVKAMTQEELRALDYQIILGNTYHLYLRPGHELVRRAGGLHKFISWDGAMLTDSGGFQVFSLEDLRSISEDGVLFKSHLDGTQHLFTPERSIEIQHSLGADIIMAFDECPPYPAEQSAVAAATDRTHRWLERCVTYHKDSGSQQLLFGIVQGGTYPELRALSAQAIASHDLPGCAIGGVSVGEPAELMQEAVASSIPYLPEDRPRYLMGVGTPQDILHAVAEGVDMFDCVLPTRLGRNGTMYTERGRINIKVSRYTEDFGPVDPDCTCAVCRRYSAAYIRHLYRCNEILAARLATYHNLAHYATLMRRIRDAVASDTYRSFMNTTLARYQELKEELGDQT